MRVKALGNLQPHDFQAQSLVIEDDKGNPIIVAIQLTEAIVYSTAGDKDFQNILASMGINKTVHVTDFKPKPLDSIIWTP